MIVETTPIDGVFVADTATHVDARGSFTRLFCDRELKALLGDRRIVQINHSRTTRRGSVRGLHYQRPPHAEMKLIRCLRGIVWDVAVDLRSGSPTFLRWHAVELSSQNTAMAIIPEGCAHGFQTLSGDCELLYLHTAPYVPDAEGGVSWNDPSIAIRWPLPLPERDGMSHRDRALRELAPGFAGIAV
jgi:dTDP-4-dehydrorhamnose 3,5-epimerase